MEGKRNDLAFIMLRLHAPTRLRVGPAVNQVGRSNALFTSSRLCPSASPALLHCELCSHLTLLGPLSFTVNTNTREGSIVQSLD